MTESRGELFDIGYQHYDGPREGRMRARKALLTNGVRTVLGLGRGARAKILPGLLFFAVMSPAVILIIVASVTGPAADIPGHAGYYQIISIFVLIFSAIMAPELLCPDRRDGVIHLYLVRPLTATDYVAGRWLAFFSITLALVYSGQVTLLVGYTFAASEPLEYLRDNWLDIPRFLGAGFVVAVFTTTLPMAVSAFTTRRAYAAAFVIGLFVISVPVAAILTTCDEDHSGPGRVETGPTGEPIFLGPEPGKCEPISGDAAKWFALIDIGRIPIHLSDMIFDEENEAQVAELVAELPDIVPVGWYLLLTLGPGLALLWRYRRMSA